MNAQKSCFCSSKKFVMWTAAALCVALAATVSPGQAAPTAAASYVPLVFSGGHDTDPRDRGRPVVLIAAALGVPTEVFREAFSHVHPAPAGSQPDPEEVRRNKEALLAALGPYGVTNERLDEVSNYYRYVRSLGQMWPATPAAGYALVRNGRVIKYVVTSGGSGYSSPPSVSVPAITRAAGKAKLSFSTDFDSNGSVSAVTRMPDGGHL